MGQVSNLIPSGSVTNMVVGALTSLIPSPTNTYHVDAAGTQVVLMWTGCEKIKKEDAGLGEKIDQALSGAPKSADKGVTIKHFADDKPAITIEPVVTMKTGTSFAGRLISWDEIEKVRITLSVLPHSKDEQSLSQLALDQEKNLRLSQKVEISTSEWKLELSITQTVLADAGSSLLLNLDSKRKTTKTTFYDGRLVEINGGYGENGTLSVAHSTTTDARLSSNSYVFEFTGWTNKDQKASSSLTNMIKNYAMGAIRTVTTSL